MNYKDKYKMIVLYFKDSPEDRKRVDWLKSCGTSMNEEVKRLIDLAISLDNERQLYEVERDGQ